MQEYPLPNAPKVLGAVRPNAQLPLPATRRGVMRKEKGVRRPRFEAQTALGGHFSTLDPNPPLYGKPRDALGRRAAEGVPDSQSASERGERANGPKSPREQGWRHLVVN